MPVSRLPRTPGRRAARATRLVPALSLAFAALAAAAPARAQTTMASMAPPADARVGLRAGWMNAGTAQWNLRLVSTTPPPAQFTDTADPGSWSHSNSDLAFRGNYVFQGNFTGVEVWDISEPQHPALTTALICPATQNDVSVYRDLLFVSVESTSGRVDCGGQGVRDTVSAERMRGVRIFDISDVAHPRLVTNVQTCRGSHTHTLVTDPRDSANLYIYVSGSAPVRSPSELAGCSSQAPERDPSSELFRLEVIQVPLAHPEQAHVVSKPPVLSGLTAPPGHGEAPEDVAAAAQHAAEARARGAYTARVMGQEIVAPPQFVKPLLDSIVAARHGTGAPTGADSAALRDAFQGLVDRYVQAQMGGAGAHTGPVQCHDVTAYPAIGLAGGACAGYGVILDIRDPANPRRIAAVSDSNFSYWHSATFSNDGSKVLFSDEWGGGGQPRCRATDRREWGADAIFSLRDTTLTFDSYYKLPAPQTVTENCVAHNGSLVPVPGRDVMVQGWYQGGISVFDFTDAAHPKEIAYFDRGPMDSTKLEGAGSWSAYWYNGHIISSEIARGLDVLELLPSPMLSQNEIDAARTVRFDQLNVQDQPRYVWPATFVLARAYLDQLERADGLAAARVAAARTALAAAEHRSGTARRTALTRLAGELDRDAQGAADRAKVRTLAAEVRQLAEGRS